MSHYSNSKYWIANRLKLLMSLGIINLGYAQQGYAIFPLENSSLEIQQIVSGRVLNEQGKPLEGVSVSLVVGMGKQKKASVSSKFYS